MSTDGGAPLDRDARRADALACAAVLLFAVVAFVRTLGYELYLDDNHHARPWTLAEVLGTFHGPFDPLGIEPPYFRPLVVVTFALDWALWGWNAWGYHLSNVILHALAAGGVFVLCRMLGLPRLAALAGGMYFAIIPANAATAVYISERSDAMVVIFSIASLQSLRWFRDSGRAVHLIGANAMLLLGVCSKEIAITIAPLLVLFWLYCDWNARDDGGQRGLVALLADLRAFLTGGQVFSLAAVRRALVPCGIPIALVALFLVYRAEVLPTAIGARYSEISPAYAFLSAMVWTLKAVPWEVRPFGLPFLLVTAACALLLGKPRVADLRAAVFGVLWIATTCLPLSYLGQVEPRLLYQPEVGHAVIAAALAAVLLDALTRVPAATLPVRASIAVPAVLLVLAQGYALVKSQDEFLPLGPKILHGFDQVLKSDKVEKWPAHHRERIKRILAEHPPPQ
jgi:hypothetical protein